MEQFDLLGQPSKQKRRSHSSQETKEKVILTEISAILTKSSIETGKEHLDLISEILYFVCLKIKNSTCLEEALNLILTACSPQNRNKIFSASRQAMEDNIPQDTKKNLDYRLQKNYIACMKELELMGAKSRDIILAIDGTPVETKSKYLNNQYSYVNIGQKNTWKRGMNFSGIFDCTNQQFVTNLHLNYHKSKHKKGDVQDFIKQLQMACKTVEMTGSSVKYIDADRGYYDAELYAAAHFNILSAQCDNQTDITVIAPTKFTRGKINKKIAFLENPNSDAVFLDHMALSKYTHPALIERCKAAGLKKKNSLFLIPIIKVALVDEYSSKTNRTLPELRREWLDTKNNLINSENRLKRLNKCYVAEQTRVGIKKPKKITKITGRKRKLFKTAALKEQYHSIRATQKYIDGLKKKKHQMLNALMFFTISITEHELKNFDPKKFIAKARVYHERWGIEIGFKEDKSKFIRSSRSRKSTQRQWNLSAGMMLYNWWHVERMKMMLEIERKTAWNRVPYDPRHPHIRRKWERKHGNMLGAESYLLRLLGEGIRRRLEKILT